MACNSVSSLSIRNLGIQFQFNKPILANHNYLLINERQKICLLKFLDLFTIHYLPTKENTDFCLSINKEMQSVITDRSHNFNC